MTAETTKLAALTTNPNGAPRTATTTPASAGPIVIAPVCAVLRAAFADCRSSGGTSVGFSDDIAG